nr:hypothetical protein HmN_000174200 [Hymenolepis microstoma]
MDGNVEQSDFEYISNNHLMSFVPLDSGGFISLGCLSSVVSSVPMDDGINDFSGPLIPDNRMQICSLRFEKYCRQRTIGLIYSPSFHPQSAGLAEGFVDKFKKALLKAKEGKNWTTCLLTSYGNVGYAYQAASGIFHFFPEPPL